MAQEYFKSAFKSWAFGSLENVGRLVDSRLVVRWW